MSDFITFVVWMGTQLANGFSSFRNIYFWDSGVSLFTVFVSFMFLDLILWFVAVILHMEYAKAQKEARKEAYGTPESRDEERLSSMDETIEYGTTAGLDE